MELAFMSHLFLFVACCCLLNLSAEAQKRWDGGGHDGQWNNALNWTNNTLPVSTDDVILDNSLVLSNYTVKLPSGNTAITVKTIFISPAAGDSIELTLPSTNTAVPALTVTGPGYGITLNNRAVFRNASGAASGTPVNVADSIKLRSGGKWIHQTGRAHASNIQVLSAIIGTEQGIFEFDAPDASTTLSFSGRTFGKLVLKAVAAGGVLNYTAAGTSRVRIRSDLEINTGVTCGLNFTDTVFVEGDYIQNGGTFNLGNTNRSVVLSIGGNITQASSATITETGTGTQEILLRGNTAHALDIKGNILNQVAFTMDGSDATLNSSLNLPYKLTLRNGVIKSTAANLIHLLPACNIFADTLSDKSFIDGPMKKDGLSQSNFLFPVGTGGHMRWLRLKGATGDFTVQYFKSNPRAISGSNGTGIDHISQLEYWRISGNLAADNASPILSFIDPQSGGVTNLQELRVARLMNNVWEDAGNTASAGSAGGNGWVSSVAASALLAENNYFALAGSTGLENALPLVSLVLKAEKKGEQIAFTWNVKADEELAYFYLQASSDGLRFHSIDSISAQNSLPNYHFEVDCISNRYSYFRICSVDKHGTTFSSRIVNINKFEDDFSLTGHTLTHNQFTATVTTPRQCMMRLIVTDMNGIMRKNVYCRILKGANNLHLDLTGLPAGIYQVFGMSSSAKTNTFRFIVL